MSCDYSRFVTVKIQNLLNHYYSLQSRGLDPLMAYGVEKKIEALTELAEELGVELE